MQIQLAQREGGDKHKIGEVLTLLGQLGEKEDCAFRS